MSSFANEQEYEAAVERIGGIPKKTHVKRGTPAEKRAKQAQKAENTKGQIGEKTSAAKIGGRVNNQRQWGSINNPDISAGIFDIENKTGPVSIRKELDLIVSKTSPPRKPGLIFEHNGEWIAVRLADRLPFAKHIAEVEGYYLRPYGEGDSP